MKPIAIQPELFFKKMQAICVLIIMITISHSICEAQVVSHELRRLAISTNQFGIDGLKALDRIEPPDKVLVFCPACLSSSLMMIMMGSSKYQVVSALRHALYVWSMKPQEINRGFKDIFEHIGLNQYQQSSSTHQTPFPDATMRSFHKRSTSFNISNSRNSKNDKLHFQNDRTSRNSDSNFLVLNPGSLYLSLPKLIRLREVMDQSNDADSINLWRKTEKNLSSGSRELKEAQSSTSSSQTMNYLHAVNSNTTKEFKHDQRDNKNLSQMSALSNIYIQRGLAMNYNYNLLLRQYYKTVIHPVDFMRNGEETRQHINSLIAANTEGKIKDLVGREIFGTASSPRIMVISTFHFRGILDIQLKAQEHMAPQFNKSRSVNINRFFNQTLHHDQYPTRGKFFIETEETLLKHGQFPDLGCSVVEIPFNNRLVSLIIVMPNHHNLTELLLTKLSAQILSDMINSLVVKKISLEIPVIKFDRGPINVEGMLKDLGLNNLFFGEKMYTSETGLNRWLRPSDIVHETSIDIGTINPKWTQTEDRLKVGAHDDRSSDAKFKSKRFAESSLLKLDKPFFYFVLDSINGLVLTMGRIRQ